MDTLLLKIRDMILATRQTVDRRDHLQSQY